ncbi:GNAT family N-acetyltransferase [Chryseobacterium scophthalmum]|uniref:GNAT family N-acetyltransferase n=1 Tax=Chryseobacterium scophthalmum TaxID=59733 RepID=UPI000C9E9155|nr:GNAT family N-acetyltransferase [Chryseobacterium scophthalmum]
MMCNNVYIRPLQENDAETSYKWRNDPSIWAFTASKPNNVITPEIEKRWMQKVIKDETSRRFAIIADNNYIGNIQITNINNDSAEYHIFIGVKEWWGKGISHLATYQILHFSKEILKLKKIYLSVSQENISAIKSYIKSGFTEVARENGWLKMECKLIELSIPTVSVFCMVYNHERFISEAIEGFLMQKTNFNTIMVIGEDCSSDNSRAIIQKYADNYPGKFKLLFHQSNVGPNKNQEIVLNNCDGKYIAMCEGDDYWIDPYKLKKQVDLLEKFQEVSIVYTNYKVRNETKNVEYIHQKIVKDQYRDENFNYLYTGDIRTLTCMFPKSKLDAISYILKNEKLQKNPCGDRAILLGLSSVGKIHYLPDVTGVYRLFEGVSAMRFTSPINKYKTALKGISSELIVLNIIDVNNPKLIIKKYYRKFLLFLICNLLKINIFNNLYIYLYNKGNKDYSNTGYF